MIILGVFLLLFCFLTTTTKKTLKISLLLYHLLNTVYTKQGLMLIIIVYQHHEVKALSISKKRSWSKLPGTEVSRLSPKVSTYFSKSLGTGESGDTTWWETGPIDPRGLRGWEGQHRPHRAACPLPSLTVSERPPGRGSSSWPPALTETAAGQIQHPKAVLWFISKSDILQLILPGELSGQLLPDDTKGREALHLLGLTVAKWDWRLRGQLLPKRPFTRGNYEEPQTEDNGKRKHQRKGGPWKSSKLCLLTPHMEKPRHRDGNRFAQGHTVV